MSSHVSVYIGLPTRRHSGDVTVTDGMGKFYSFFWGTPAWSALGREEQGARLVAWLNWVPISLSQGDRDDIGLAVLGTADDGGDVAGMFVREFKRHFAVD